MNDRSVKIRALTLALGLCSCRWYSLESNLDIPLKSLCQALDQSGMLLERPGLLIYGSACDEHCALRTLRSLSAPENGAPDSLQHLGGPSDAPGASRSKGRARSLRLFRNDSSRTRELCREHSEASLASAQVGPDVPRCAREVRASACRLTRRLVALRPVMLLGYGVMRGELERDALELCSMRLRTYSHATVLRSCHAHGRAVL